MSTKYTAMQAELAALTIDNHPLEIDWQALKVELDGKVIAGMLREYAAILTRQPEVSEDMCYSVILEYAKRRRVALTDEMIKDMRAALTAVLHNRPAQEKATNYVSGHVDSVGKFHATAQEKAEPVATTCEPVRVTDDYDEPTFSEKDWERLGKLPAGTKLYTAPPAERVRVQDEDIRWLLSQPIHAEFDHDMERESDRCPVCQRIKRIKAMLSAAPEADHD